jgi:molybdopterin-guanine dinucleotide biosynthesis protein A
MGRPKALLPFGPEVMLERVVRIVSEVVSPVVVVAAVGQALPPLPAHVRIARDVHEAKGPLAGLSVGLAALRGEVDAAYASGCDVPLLRPEFLRAVLAELQDHEIAIPREGTLPHPLAGVYRTSLVERIDALIAANRLRPWFLVQESDARGIDVEDLRPVDPELESLRNANTPEDYAAVLKAAGFAP